MCNKKRNVFLIKKKKRNKENRECSKNEGYVSALCGCCASSNAVLGVGRLCEFPSGFG
jgi:hypothetical protein